MGLLPSVVPCASTRFARSAFNKRGVRRVWGLSRHGTAVGVSEKASATKVLASAQGKKRLPAGSAMSLYHKPLRFPEDASVESFIEATWMRASIAGGMRTEPPLSMLTSQITSPFSYTWPRTTARLVAWNEGHHIAGASAGASATLAAVAGTIRRPIHSSTCDFTAGVLRNYYLQPVGGESQIVPDRDPHQSRLIKTASSSPSLCRFRRSAE
jgi:hypothetical protein